MIKSTPMDKVLCKFWQGNLQRDVFKMEVFDLERWNVIAWLPDVAHFLKERLFDQSDAYSIHVYEHWGLIAIANLRKNYFECKGYKNTRYTCWKLHGKPLLMIMVASSPTKIILNSLTVLLKIQTMLLSL